MTDEIRSLILPILRGVQTRLGRLEGRMTNLDLRMTAQEQQLGALLTGLPADQDRIDDLVQGAEPSSGAWTRVALFDGMGLELPPGDGG